MFSDKRSSPSQSLMGTGYASGLCTLELGKPGLRSGEQDCEVDPWERGLLRTVVKWTPCQKGEGGGSSGLCLERGKGSSEL